MNEFKLEGEVVEVESKRGPKKDWHLIYIMTPGGDKVGVPCFGQPPDVGETISAEGKLVSHQGYLRLEVKRLHMPRKLASVPAMKRLGAG